MTLRQRHYEEEVVKDEIACSTALAVLTEQNVSTEKKTRGAVSIERLREAVQTFFEQLKISLSEINRRIRTWIEFGWMEQLEDGRIRPTKKGRPVLEKLAMYTPS